MRPSVENIVEGGDLFEGPRNILRRMVIRSPLEVISIQYNVRLRYFGIEYNLTRGESLLNDFTLFFLIVKYRTSSVSLPSISHTKTKRARGRSRGLAVYFL